MNHTKFENALMYWGEAPWSTNKKQKFLISNSQGTSQNELNGILQYASQLRSRYNDRLLEQYQSLYTSANHFGEDLNVEISLVLPRGMKNARGFQQLLVAAVLLDHPFVSLIREAAIERAREKQYKGSWMVVQHLVENSYSSTLLTKLLLEEHSGRALMGWLQDAAVALLYNSTCRSTVQRGPVKRSNQIGVGYRDKGARVPDHVKIIEQTHTGANPESFDFSTLAYKRNSIMNFLTVRSTKLIPQNNKIKKKRGNKI